MLSSLETLSTDVPAALVQHLTPLTMAIETLQTSQQALTEAVSQQESHLEAQITASQGDSATLLSFLPCLLPQR
ncbi:hypothetical protein EAO18_28755 [Klebsiella pneumoniae]|nr:hypothetical protein EAO18_28755 [Klebsiella pneumoniae]